MWVKVGLFKLTISVKHIQQYLLFLDCTVRCCMNCRLIAVSVVHCLTSLRGLCSEQQLARQCAVYLHNGESGQMATPAGRLRQTAKDAHRQERSRQVAGCAASTGPLWCHGEVEHCTLYSLLCLGRLALLDASSFLKCNRQITPSDWMLG